MCAEVERVGGGKAESDSDSGEVKGIDNEKYIYVSERVKKGVRAS